MSSAIAPEYLAPLYSQADVVSIVGATRSSVSRWVTGYEDGGVPRKPLITHSATGRGLTVPFIGLAEAFVLTSFRRAGVPMQRIRPAVEQLKNGIGLEHALASNRLVTDGAEILLRSEDTRDPRLVVVRNNQAVFNEVVADYLRGIRFEDGFASSFLLPQYPVPVSVDPHYNGGRPTVRTRGIALDDIIGRLRAGEELRSVAEDYEIADEEILALNRAAAA